ncbi:peptide chain release factor N(5)-glutamine methyltransferase [Methylosoma difficile]
MTNIQTALREAAHNLADRSDSAQLDAEVLLAFALGKSRSHLRAWPERELDAASEQQFLNLLAARQQGQPIAYLTGVREFWSREFFVNADVLIPRPETELLIELSLALIAPQQSVDLIDLGTGSGIIAITLALECPQARVCAVDASAAALAVAQANAVRLQAQHIQFYQSDWFTDVPAGRFDLVISNPPYIADHDHHLQQGDVRFEPNSALIAAEQGLSDLQQIADSARSRLKTGGYLLMEHGYDQQAAVQKLLTGLAYQNIQTHTDLSGQPRVTVGQW